MVQHGWLLRFPYLHKNCGMCQLVQYEYNHSYLLYIGWLMVYVALEQMYG